MSKRSLILAAISWISLSPLSFAQATGLSEALTKAVKADPKVAQVEAALRSCLETSVRNHFSEILGRDAGARARVITKVETRQQVPMYNHEPRLPFEIVAEATIVDDQGCKLTQYGAGTFAVDVSSANCRLGTGLTDRTFSLSTGAIVNVEFRAAKTAIRYDRFGNEDSFAAEIRKMRLFSYSTSRASRVTNTDTGVVLPFITVDTSELEPCVRAEARDSIE